MAVSWALWALMALWACAQAEEGPVRAPSGWSDTTEHGARVLRKGPAAITVSPWMSLEGASLEDWLAARAPAVQPEGGAVTSSSAIKPESRFDGWSVNRKAQLAGGAAGQSVLVACPGPGGTGRLLHLVVPNTSFGAMLQGSSFVERACLNVPEQVTVVAPDPQAPAAPAPAAPTPAAPAPTATPPTATAAVAPRGPLSPASPPPGLRDVRGVLTMGLQAGGMFGTTERFIATFDDGAYTRDLQRTFGEGIAASRRAEPEDWGRYRMRGGTLQLRKPGDDDFGDTRGSWVTSPGKADQRLSGCFGRLTSSGGGDYTSGVTVGLASSWCFWPDGRFTHDATAFGTASAGSGVSGATSSTRPTARGRYRIDGYVARFVYDDGHEVVAAFCFANDDRDHVMLNGRRFMGR